MEYLNVRLGDRSVGASHPPYIIAEIGSNHNGDMELCRRLVDAAIESGVDAVKFQSWSKSSIVSTAEFARNTKYSDTKRHFGSLEEMVDRYQFTPDQHREIKKYCDEKGVHFLSSAFSNSELDLLSDLDVPAIKIASMDINHLPLLSHAGKIGKPIILSTGMSTLGEIERALALLRESGAVSVILLHCVSIYPPDLNDVHLRNITTLQHAFGVPVGFSDHTIGTTIPLASVAVGACMIEKHFTIDKNLDGWDHHISADPMEMKEIVEHSRQVHAALGSNIRTVSRAELQKRQSFRRRIVLRRAMSAGETLTEGDLDYKRPGNGIGPDEVRYVVGRRLAVDLEQDHELEWNELT